MATYKACWCDGMPGIHIYEKDGCCEYKKCPPFLKVANCVCEEDTICKKCGKLQIEGKLVYEGKNFLKTIITKEAPGTATVNGIPIPAVLGEVESYDIIMVNKDGEPCDHNGNACEN